MGRRAWMVIATLLLGSAGASAAIPNPYPSDSYRYCDSFRSAYVIDVFASNLSCSSAVSIQRELWRPGGDGTLPSYPTWTCYSGSGGGSCELGSSISAYQSSAPGSAIRALTFSVGYQTASGSYNAACVLRGLRTRGERVECLLPAIRVAPAAKCERIGVDSVVRMTLSTRRGTKAVRSIACVGGILGGRAQLDRAGRWARRGYLCRLSVKEQFHCRSPRGRWFSVNLNGKGLRRG